VLRGSGAHVTSYRAVTKKELEMYAFVLWLTLTFRLYYHSKKDMSGEENMVLSHIQASGNEGPFTNVDGSNEIKNRHNYFFLGRNMDETPEGEN
jgi:DNA-directed RNA polymerase III subunit RPC6